MDLIYTINALRRHRLNGRANRQIYLALIKNLNFKKFAY